MGKDNFLTPKAIANRIKSKGLQKLRWYCQLCEKQCRDENGFKCHQTSEKHLRQMALFGSQAGKVVNNFSRDFETAFLEHLKRAHPFSRVLAQNVYNEYIADKQHIHMNSTQWLTLTDFIKHLGREGKVKVEETEKGWYITLIMKDPMEEIAEEKRLKRTIAEKEEEERWQAEINAQVARARKVARVGSSSGDADDGEAAGDALVKTDDAPLVLSLVPGAAAASGAPGAAGPSGALGLLRPTAPKASAFVDEEEERGQGAGPSGRGPAKGASKLDELMRKELEAKARQAEADKAAAAANGGGRPAKEVPWLYPGIVVKVMSRELEQHGYYKKKGVVDKVVDRFVGEIAMLDSGDVVRVDQAQLESVLPQPGGTVLAVRGPYKGWAATLQEINVKRFQALIKYTEGPGKGTEAWVEYEDVSKLSKA